LGTGASGDISISARSIRIDSLDGPTFIAISAVSRAQSDAGQAGNLIINADADMTVRFGAIGVSATAADAGNLEIFTGGSLHLLSSELTAASGRNGGNLRLAAGDGIRAVQSLISAQAFNDGGEITANAPIVSLNSSIINGVSGGTPVEVIVPESAALLVSSDTLVFTSAPQLPPIADITGSIVPGQSVSFADANRLRESCRNFFLENYSTFVIQSPLFFPPEPGGWLNFTSP
jgi:hypothetical protein